ncbi:MAG: glycosyltransferase [Anaerolineae bacterium]|nr:glycosyltransferase [Anaerolineae bacterium]
MPVSHPDVGMVVPTWYPADADEALVRSLLERTLVGVERYCRPEMVAVVLDGQPRWREAVGRAAEERGLRYLYLPTNLGKGGALAAGMAAVLPEEPAFIVTRDSDGDHRLEDMPALLELARQMQEETGAGLVIVSGGRPDRARPLGFERAQYEILTDRVLWQALQFHSARMGRQLSSTYFAAFGDYPDIQSGYKVYSRAAAEMAATALSHACEEGEGGGLSRCGVETIPAVEVLAAGGEMGVVARRTLQEQPVSGYRGVDARRMYAEPLAWALRRLRVPGGSAAVLLDGALLRSPLAFDYRRREELLAVRDWVLEALGAPRPLAWGARFV